MNIFFSQCNELIRIRYRRFNYFNFTFQFRYPIKKEYDRAYDRLAKRKSNGLEYPEWLEKITLAMDIKERGESGEISLDEAIRLLKEI